MGWQKDALTGLAVRYDAAGIGTWRTAAALGSIVLGTLPDEIDTGIGLQGYRVGADDPANPTTQLRVQCWLRASEAEIDDLDSQVYDATVGLAGAVLGTATVTLARSISALPVGVTARGQVERACNYALDLDLPPTPLRSY